VRDISLILTEGKTLTPSQPRSVRNISLILTEGKTPIPHSREA